jgi:hypothetical protein
MLSRLDRAALVLPVYASQLGSPRHHATLGSGRWPAFSGQVRPAGLHREVSSLGHRVLLTQAWPGAHHLHLIVEAASGKALSRAMKGLLVSIAKRLNAIAGRKGRVFADRYHTSMLATPTQVRNGLAYTLLNFRKHGEARPSQRLDPYSSAFALPDWTPDGLIPLRGVNVLPVALPKTWLLREGWRRAGSISPWDTPSA